MMMMVSATVLHVSLAKDSHRRGTAMGSYLLNSRQLLQKK